MMTWISASKADFGNRQCLGLPLVSGLYVINLRYLLKLLLVVIFPFTLLGLERLFL